MIRFLRKLFYKPKFFDKDGKEIKYIKYLKKENMLIIERDGMEKIPANSLRKEY